MIEKYSVESWNEKKCHSRWTISLIVTVKASYHNQLSKLWIYRKENDIRIIFFSHWWKQTQMKRHDVLVFTRTKLNVRSRRIWNLSLYSLIIGRRFTIREKKRNFISTFEYSTLFVSNCSMNQTLKQDKTKYLLLTLESHERKKITEISVEREFFRQYFSKQIEIETCERDSIYWNRKYNRSLWQLVNLIHHWMEWRHVQILLVSACVCLYTEDKFVDWILPDLFDEQMLTEMATTNLR